MKYAYKERIALFHEREKLARLENSRIVFTGLTLYIDLWCNGDETESDHMIKITQKHRRLIQAVLRIENETIS